ncbi:muscarinic acetylcholine receptor M2-like [Xyrauchen texanus]|uniref:muscarinic acetylcholine receptor M2-like n=1 Tax=Xyrauchen texanus TaxID=154827 RepID=UPI0022429FED|nr:muscarinic acetylcholine receptor M2-like [Xyrauchen texanus]
METSNLTLAPSSSHANKSNLFLDSPFTPVKFVLIVLGLSTLSLITIIGNILVMLSIKVNRNLQTVNNYFLFSLACADLFIGVFSMNLYTVYIVIGHWPLGTLVCDLWLALDYVVSNASVMNLLIISFDRYFCVTKPLSYPVKRTHKMAGMMIAAAWILSFILWAPAILFWQFITGTRTVPEGECYIQFFSNAVVTFGTAIAAFYLPVVTMTILYWHISKASRNRVRSRDSQRGPSVSNNERQVVPTTEGSGERKSIQEAEEMVPRRQSASDATTGEERESENDSLSGSVLGSSNQRDEDAISPSTNNDNKSRQTQSAPLAKESWVKFTCFRSASQKDLENTYKPSNGCQNMNNGKERLSIVSQKILISHYQKKRKNLSSREKKVTRTIMAILVAFAVTWTPYNVMVLINTFCSTCIPNTMWIFGYWLCYINSTVNPACYALCNVTFKNTFKQLLTCKYRNIQRRKH